MAVASPPHRRRLDHLRCLHRPLLPKATSSKGDLSEYDLKFQKFFMNVIEFT
jgi:hypothetical protein